MSDEHKPHDPAEEGAVSPPAEPTAIVEDAAPPEASSEAPPEDSTEIPAEAAAEAARADAESAPAVDIAAQDEGPATAAEPETATVAIEPAAPAAAEDAAGMVAEASAVDPVAVAAAGTAAAAAASGRRPVWSDDGDAPFEETPAPVYDRKAGKSKKARSARPAKGGSAGSETWEIIKTVFFALLIAMVLRILLFQPFTIPSASMEPNLYEGDYIVVSKWSYGYSRHSIPFSPPVFEGRLMGRAPERGDVAVFKLPRDNRTDYIKRVIGLPGDQVQMLNNVLHINGQPVPDVVVERAQIQDIFGPRPVTRSRETLPGGRSFTVQDFGPGGDLDDTPLYVVPAGHYFMMGDNRDNSIDSRVEMSAGVGMVPEENLVGKAEIILFSWSPGASLFNPVSWFANIRPSRFFTVLD